MASGQKQLARSVLVTFSTFHAPPQFEYPERRIILESKGPDSPNSSIKIGRTSKRFQELEAKENNLYFDSPVMSREHAELSVDWYHKKVFIKDSSSLHGTHLNNIRVRPGHPCELSQGNILKFGIDIQRSTETFPPCTVEVAWEWDPASHSSEKINNRPAFKVPDDSDSSDNDDDESDIRATVEKMRTFEQYRTNRSFSNMASIDLTRESPKPSPVASRSIIVIEDDVQKADVPELEVPEGPGLTPANVPISSQPTSDAVLDIDAPHDEEADIHDHPLRPLCLESDSASDKSSEDEPPHYLDHVSSQSNSSVDDDICLSDSLSGSDNEEDLSNDDQVVNDSDSEQDVSSDDEGIDSPADYDLDDNNSIDEYGSQVDEPTWEIPTSPQQQPSFDKSEAIYPPQTPSQVTTNQSYFPPTMSPFSTPTQTLPRTPRVRLPGRETEGLKLPPLHTVSDLHSAQSWDMQSPQRPFPQFYVPPVVLETNSRLPQNDGPSAEDLGQMTGKLEYFAAREHNKSKMHHEFGKPSPKPTQLATTGKVIADDALSQTCSTNVEATKSTQTSKSAWMSSGKEFLNSPQAPSIPLREASPEYDMTSAYQFQQSKLAASFPATEVSQPAAVSTKTAGKELTKSLKRKADDISTLLLEEQAVEASASATEKHAGEVAQSTTANGEIIVAQAVANATTATEAPKTEFPPAKRRFLPSWKGVGTFGAGISAGGIMLAGMLAMSAPNL